MIQFEKTWTCSVCGKTRRLKLHSLDKKSSEKVIRLCCHTAQKINITTVPAREQILAVFQKALTYHRKKAFEIIDFMETVREVLKDDK